MPPNSRKRAADLSKPLAGIDVRVDRAEAGVRLDLYLRKRLIRSSRTRAQRLVDDGKVLVNGAPAKASHVLRTGDLVHVAPPEAKGPDLPEAREIPLAILYEDEDLLVVDKPPNVAVHPAGRFHYNTLVNALHVRYRRSDDPSRDVVPKLVNRLDRETSGLVLVSKNEAAHASLAAAFANRSVEKEYRAIVYGRVDPPSGTVDLPLGRDLASKLGLRQAVRFDEGFPSTTRYEALGAAGGFTLLRLLPRTGRQHQLRVHLLALGHPIVGDKLYVGGDEVFRATQDREPDEIELRRLLLPRQALHAARLRFPHPRTGVAVEVEAPLPPDMAELWRRIESGQVPPVDWRDGGV